MLFLEDDERNYDLRGYIDVLKEEDNILLVGIGEDIGKVCLLVCFF